MKYQLTFFKYRNGRVAVRVFEDGTPYATLSTNVEDLNLQENEFILNHDLLHPMFASFLNEMLATGLVRDTGTTCRYGFCGDVPIWKRVV